MAEVAKAHMDARKINASLQVTAQAELAVTMQPSSRVRAGVLLRQGSQWCWAALLAQAANARVA